jgi:predicted nucleotidyltransferase
MNDDADVKRLTRYFRDRDEISTLYVFGSLGKAKKTNESDIDIAVLIDESKLKRKALNFSENP